jgi:2-C-methyl-D-erythritol 4-phosphate cytidylyltransferase
VQAPDALKKIDDGGFISNHLQRNRTMAIQTPQGFLFNEIYEAHTMARSDNVPYIDDTEIYSTYIGKVFTVPGDPVNRKITFPCDLETAGP